MRGALAAAGVGERVDAFADERHVGRVVGSRSLGGVLRACEEGVFQLGHGGACFFDEGHEFVGAALGPNFLGQGEKAEVLEFLDGAVGEFGAGGEGSHDHEAALEVLHAVGVVGADAAAGEEVNDSFFEDVGGLGCFAGFVFFDGVGGGIILGVTVGLVGLVFRCVAVALIRVGLVLDESATRNGRDRGHA